MKRADAAVVAAAARAVMNRRREHVATLARVLNGLVGMNGSCSMIRGEKIAAPPRSFGVRSRADATMSVAAGAPDSCHQAVNG